jgi:hypothetical protein
VLFLVPVPWWTALFYKCGISILSEMPSGESDGNGFFAVEMTLLDSILFFQNAHISIL